MLIVEYQSKSYQRFLNDISHIANRITRFLITFNGASAEQLIAATKDLTEYTEQHVQYSTVISDKAPEESVATLFNEARSSRNLLLLQNADPLFDKKMAVKNSHERDSHFDINNLLKNIAKHNGVVILATEKSQTLSASMSTKVDVVIRFPSA